MGAFALHWGAKDLPLMGELTRPEAGRPRLTCRRRVHISDSLVSIGMPVPVAAAPLPSPRRGRPPMVGCRQTILRAAALIFAQRDYHEVLMEDVAQASGVG